MRHRAGWREHAVVDASTVAVVDADAAPVGAWLGVLGQTGFTAWVGLKRIGELHEGDTVFVSAAAGAVGSAAGRFAKLLGAGRVRRQRRWPGQGRASSSTSSGTTTRWTTGPSRRADAVRRLAPDGIDVYFDNVGGPHLVAALKNMTIGGRVALCGMISQYSDDGRGEDINHLIEAVLRRVTIRGFIVRDHEDMRPEFEQTVAGWLRSGEVEALQTVTDGIDHAVEAFLGHAQGRQRRQGARAPRHQLGRSDSRVDLRGGTSPATRSPIAATWALNLRAPSPRNAASWLSNEAIDVSSSETRATAITPASAPLSLPRTVRTAVLSSSIICTRVSRRNASTTRLRPIELTKYTIACGPPPRRPRDDVRDQFVEPSGAVARRQLRPDLVEQLVGELLHALGEDLLLRGEVVVHGGGRHLDRAGDVLNGHLVDRNRREQTHRAVDDDLAARRSVRGSAGRGGGVDPGQSR